MGGRWRWSRAARAEAVVLIDKNIAASDAERGYFPSLYCSAHKLIPLVLSVPVCCVSYGKQKVIATTSLSCVPFEYFSIPQCISGLE